MKTDTGLYEEVMMKLQKVKVHGHYFSCLCPYHPNTNTPAFFVYQDGYRCASCGVRGSLKRLAHHLSGSKVQYIEQEEENDMVEVPWKEWKTLGYETIAAQAYENARAYPSLLHYLTERNLDVSVMIDRFKIGYKDGWITFPVFNADGDFTDLVIRSTPAIYTNVKYATRPRNRGEGFSLYCADWSKLQPSPVMYVPFGILDMLVLTMLGVPSATGMTGLTYNTAWFGEFRKKIVLLPDYKEEEPAYKTASALGWRGSVRKFPYQEGEKDVADVFSARGSAPILDFLSN